MSSRTGHERWIGDARHGADNVAPFRCWCYIDSLKGRMLRTPAFSDQ